LKSLLNETDQTYFSVNSTADKRTPTCSNRETCLQQQVQYFITFDKSEMAFACDC